MLTSASCAFLVVALCMGVAQAQQNAAAPGQRAPDDLYLSASKGDKVALQQLMALAESGNAQAQFHLGEVYDPLKNDTFGVPKDAVQAVGWYGKATQQGRATNAAFDLWMLAIRDDKAALEQLTKLAGKGDVQSQFQLSQMYLAGEGVPADPVQSANWLRKAAEQGLAVAQRFLGGRYEGGLGVPMNVAAAVRWYRAAAEQGDPEGEYSLGSMYYFGSKGVSRDPVQAAKWYRKSAEQGNLLAQTSLAKMYNDGIGVPRDAAEAMAWLQRAAEKGDAQAQADLDSIKNERFVSMVQKDGVYVVPVLINSTITLDFVVDSGAADVSIPADVFTTLIRTGTITDSDFIGTGTYRLADGSTTSSRTFRIRSLKVGGDLLPEN